MAKRDMSAFTGKMFGFSKDAPAVEVKPEEVVEAPVEVKAAERAEVIETIEAEPAKVEGAAPNKEVSPALPEPEKSSVKKAKQKSEEKMLGYTFKVSWGLRKRMNRVIDEISDRENKMSKKDFILEAVEKLVEAYEKKYNL